MRRLITVLTCTLLLFGCAENSQNALKSKDKSIRIELVDNSDIPPVYRVVDNVPVAIEDEVVLVEVKKPLSASEIFYIVFGQLSIIVLGAVGYVLFLRWIVDKFIEND